MLASGGLQSGGMKASFHLLLLTLLSLASSIEMLVPILLKSCMFVHVSPIAEDFFPQETMAPLGLVGKPYVNRPNLAAFVQLGHSTSTAVPRSPSSHEQPQESTAVCSHPRQLSHATSVSNRGGPLRVCDTWQAALMLDCPAKRATFWHRPAHHPPKYLPDLISPYPSLPSYLPPT